MSWPTERPALLAIPGLGLDSKAWAPTLAALGECATVLVHPLPGYGEPAARHADLHPRSLADRVFATTPLVQDRVVVLGHSASCQIAAHIAAQKSELVAGLVLVGPTTDPAGASWPRLVSRWLATAVHERPRQVPTLVRQYHRTGLVSMACAMEQARGDRIEVSLRRSSVPVLVLRGRHDRICPQRWAAEVAASGGPGSRAVTLGAGGHMVPITHGSFVAAEIRAFLAESI